MTTRPSTPHRATRRFGVLLHDAAIVRGLRRRKGRDRRAGRLLIGGGTAPFSRIAGPPGWPATWQLSRSMAAAAGPLWGAWSGGGGVGEEAGGRGRRPLRG